MTTQIIEAKNGRITEQMEYIAKKEGVSPEFVREKLLPDALLSLRIINVMMLFLPQ